MVKAHPKVFPEPEPDAGWMQGVFGSVKSQFPIIQNKLKIRKITV